MKTYELYLFDFDGTLVDTTAGIFRSVRHALKGSGLPVPPDEKLGYFIGPPLFDSFKTVCGVSDETADNLIAAFRAHYTETACEGSVLYPGIPETLKALKERGKKIAVASSKPRIFVDKISEKLGIAEYYDFIAAESLNHLGVGKEVLIQAALAFFPQIRKENALMIGDRCFDIDGAKAAGIDSAGAVFGFGNVEELTESKADYLLYRAEDLLKIAK